MILNVLTGTHTMRSKIAKPLLNERTSLRTLSLTAETGAYGVSSAAKNAAGINMDRTLFRACKEPKKMSRPEHTP